MKADLIQIQDREREDITAKGRRAATLIGLIAVSEASKAYRNGVDPSVAIARAMREAVPVLASGMAAGHLRGERRVLLNTPQVRRRVALDRSPLDKIIESLTEKLGHSPAYAQDLRAKYEAPAQAVIQTATDDVVARVRTAIEQATEERLHVDAGVSLIRDAFESAGVTKAANYQLEAIFRTGTGIGYGAGRWSKNQDPEIREILWGYEFVTAGDDRVRPEHERLNGLQMPVNDPRWAQCWPPVPSSPWNCRCDTIEIFKNDTDAAVLKIPDGAFDDLTGTNSPFGSALQWAG